MGSSVCQKGRSYWARLMAASRIRLLWCLEWGGICDIRSIGGTCCVGSGKLRRTFITLARPLSLKRSIDGMYRPWWSRDGNVACAGWVTVCFLSRVYLECRARSNVRHLSYGIWLHSGVYSHTEMTCDRMSIWIDTMLYLYLFVSFRRVYTKARHLMGDPVMSLSSVCYMPKKDVMVMALCSWNFFSRDRLFDVSRAEEV